MQFHTTAYQCNLVIKRFFPSRLALVFFCLVPAAPAASIVIVRAGKPEAAIVVGDTQTEAGRKVAAAADDLQQYIEKISGATLPILSADDKPTDAVFS